MDGPADVIQLKMQEELTLPVLSNAFNSRKQDIQSGYLYVPVYDKQ